MRTTLTGIAHITCPSLNYSSRNVSYPLNMWNISSIPSTLLSAAQLAKHPSGPFLDLITARNEYLTGFIVPLTTDFISKSMITFNQLFCWSFLITIDISSEVCKISFSDDFADKKGFRLQTVGGTNINLTTNARHYGNLDRELVIWDYRDAARSGDIGEDFLISSKVSPVAHEAVVDAGDLPSLLEVSDRIRKIRKGLSTVLYFLPRCPASFL